MIKLNNLICLLIYFIPLSLVSGPFIPDLLVSLISIFFLIEVIKEKKFFYFKNKFFLIFLIFYFISLISSIFSDNIYVSLKSSLFYFRFALLALCIYKNIYEKNFNFKIFFYFLIFDIILLNIDGYVQFFLGTNLIGFESVYGKARLSGLFGDEYILGSYLTRIIFLLVAVTYKVNIQKIEMFLIPIILSTFLLVFLSGERTAFFLFTIGILVFLILNNYKLKNKIILLLCISIPVLLALNYNKASKERYFNVLSKELGLKEWEAMLTHNDKEITFLPQHTTYFIVSLNMFKDKKIFGHGNKSFSYKCEQYKINQHSCSTHPHNSYIQLLAENGFINFSIILTPFLILLYFFFKGFIFKFKKKDLFTNYQLSLLISVFITLWPITQTGNFFNNWLSIIYFLPVGFILSEFKK